jgi:hypothetical protein
VFGDAPDGVVPIDGLPTSAAWARAEGHRTPRGRILTSEWWRGTFTQPMLCGYVTYKRRKHETGGVEWHKGKFPALIGIEDFKAIQEVRRSRTRVAGKEPKRRTYVLTQGKCGRCGGRVTAAQQGRVRCRNARMHRGCDSPSVPKERLETQLGAFMGEAMSLTPKLERLVAQIIEKELGRSFDVNEAERLHRQLRALSLQHEAGIVDDEELLNRVRPIKAKLVDVEQCPNKESALDAVRLLSSMAAFWERATLEERQRVTAYCFDEIEVTDGWISMVRPKKEIAPLLAAQVIQAAEESVRCGGPDRIRTGDLVLDRDVC